MMEMITIGTLVLVELFSHQRRLAVARSKEES